MAKSNLALVTPATVIGTVDNRPRPPRRRRNAEVRAREYLTDPEVARLIAAASGNRHGHRDATAALIAYRHGLRAAELVTLRWDAIDFAHGRVHVYRVKSGSESAIRCLAASCGPCAGSNASRIRHRRLSSRRSALRRSRPRGFVRWSRGLALPPISVSRCIRTCCGTHAASSSPMTASIPGRCRPIWATATSSTRCATPSWRPPASRTSGRIDPTPLNLCS